MIKPFDDKFSDQKDDILSLYKLISSLESRVIDIEDSLNLKTEETEVKVRTKSSVNKYVLQIKDFHFLNKIKVPLFKILRLTLISIYKPQLQIIFYPITNIFS